MKALEQGQMPRAYLRMSPDLDQHPDPLSMVRAMCAAARQPQRGRFREEVVLERAVGRKQLRSMKERGDVVPANPGPGIYLDGWDEWQEGDYTVAERMRRVRKKRRDAKSVTGVTAAPSPARTDVTTDALGGVNGSSSSAVGVGDSPPPQAGRRKNGTNPRAAGTNPRAKGTSPRQIREAEKTGPTKLADTLAQLARDEDGKYVVNFRPAPKPSQRKTA